MAYIIDADWVIQATSGDRTTLAILDNLASESIAISWLTVAEIYEVAFNTPNPSAYIREMQRFLDRHWTIGVDGPIVEQFAELRAFLRRRGQLISPFDIFLAATALRHDLTVLTYNTRHFERVPDLRIYRLG